MARLILSSGIDDFEAARRVVTLKTKGWTDDLKSKRRRIGARFCQNRDEFLALTAEEIRKEKTRNELIRRQRQRKPLNMLEVARQIEEGAVFQAARDFEQSPTARAIRDIETSQKMFRAFTKLSGQD